MDSLVSESAGPHAATNGDAVASDPDAALRALRAQHLNDRKRGFPGASSSAAARVAINTAALSAIDAELTMVRAEASDGRWLEASHNLKAAMANNGRFALRK